MGWDLWPRESKLGDLAFFLDCMRKGLWQSLFSSSSLELFPLLFLTNKPFNYSFIYLRSESDHFILLLFDKTLLNTGAYTLRHKKFKKILLKKFFSKKPKSVCPLQRICNLISTNQIHHNIQTRSTHQINHHNIKTNITRQPTIQNNISFQLIDAWQPSNQNLLQLTNQNNKTGLNQFTNPSTTTTTITINNFKYILPSMSTKAIFVSHIEPERQDHEPGQEFFCRYIFYFHRFYYLLDLVLVLPYSE